MSAHRLGCLLVELADERAPGTFLAALPACRGERDHVRRRRDITLVTVGVDLVKAMEGPGQ